MDYPAWVAPDGVRLSVDFVADPANVRTVRKLLAAAARIEGATDLEAFFIEVAVGEVLVRGRVLDKGGIGTVSLRAELSRRRCVVSVSEPDRGQQGGAETNEHADERLRWGLHVIAQLMDEVEIRPAVRKGQASELRLVSQLGKDRLAKGER
jgi:anti-sigma regulatory factor (Ser/Thr protein kinase)